MPRTAKSTSWTLSLFSAVAIVAVGACSSSSDEEKSTDDPPSAVQYQMDWAEYKSVEDLSQQAQRAVLVDLGPGVGTWDTPDYSSEDPRINPYAGTGHTPSQKEIQEASLPVTQFSAKVVDASHGSDSAPDIESGNEIIIQQPGGLVDGELYEIVGSEPLKEGDRVLLFIRASPLAPSVHIILGGPAGTFHMTPDGGAVSDSGEFQVSRREIYAVLNGS